MHLIDIPPAHNYKRKRKTVPYERNQSHFFLFLSERILDVQYTRYGREWKFMMHFSLRMARIDNVGAYHYAQQQESLRLERTLVSFALGERVLSDLSFSLTGSYHFLLWRKGNLSTDKTLSSTACLFWHNSDDSLDSKRQLIEGDIKNSLLSIHICFFPASSPCRWVPAMCICSGCQYLHFNMSQVQLQCVEIEVCFDWDCVYHRQIQNGTMNIFFQHADFNSFHLPGNLLSRKPPKATSSFLSFCGLWLTSDRRWWHGTNERDSTYRVVYLKTTGNGNMHTCVRT